VHACTAHRQANRHQGHTHTWQDVYHEGSLSGVDLRLQDAQAVLGRVQLQRLASRQGACIGLVFLSLRACVGIVFRSLGVAFLAFGLAFLQRPLSRYQFSQPRL
jgi:hypothetical protein